MDEEPDDEPKKILLTPEQRSALIDAAILLVDEACNDFATISNGGSIDDTYLFAEYLPKQFRHYYSETFLKKFLICIIRVADRLKDWDGENIPTCTAECLALRAIVQEADGDFDLFVDYAFPDADADLLFVQELDGIEDTDVADEMNMYLRPSEWFEPAYGHIHPCCEIVLQPGTECMGEQEKDAADKSPKVLSTVDEIRRYIERTFLHKRVHFRINYGALEVANYAFCVKYAGLVHGYSDELVKIEQVGIQMEGRSIPGTIAYANGMEVPEDQRVCILLDSFYAKCDNDGLYIKDMITGLKYTICTLPKRRETDQ